MNTGVTMRNSKVRTFLYVLLGCCMLFTVFMLSSTHTKLKDSQESNDKCQQQRDSLSAQLQVVYEHKSRLEKTLQVEIADRKRAEDGVKLVRDQSERDRADARNKIKSLQQQLSDSQVAQAEEFKNLKSSYAALDQEKEKVYAELASHITLLQQERDAKLKLTRQLEELQQSRKADTQMEAMLQKKLETCRAETAQLYVKLQQQNSVVPQQPVASAGNEKPGASADLLEGNGIKLQPAASELKTNAKLPTRSERFAAGSNLQQQVVAPLLRPPPQLSAPQWGGAQLHRPHMVPPHNAAAARYEPHNAVVAHFDPRNQDPVRAFLHANRHRQPQQQHHQEEYQLAAPNLNAHDGSHAAMHQAVLAAAEGWRREH